ncbi:MAG: hypothetical protein AAF557_25310 [Pseudomonadota bacterium]
MTEMKHLQEFRRRNVRSLALATQNNWRLKRYAILADGREFDADICSSATDEAFKRLPTAGSLDDEETNHGIGFQIIHFAEVAVVSPIFFWQWGSVLAHIDQIRAPWSDPTAFGDGLPEIFGCVWEMEIVHFEVATWRATMLTNDDAPAERLENYISQYTHRSRPRVG